MWDTSYLIINRSIVFAVSLLVVGNLKAASTAGGRPFFIADQLTAQAVSHFLDGLALTVNDVAHRVAD